VSQRVSRISSLSSAPTHTASRTSTPVTPCWKATCKRFGKTKDLANLNQIHSQATYTFVEQREDAGYGTAVPLQVAADHLPKDEAFIVCGSDDFMWRTDGGSDLKDLVDTFQKSNAAGALMSIEKSLRSCTSTVYLTSRPVMAKHI
jgi:UTP-glucose-1-phosphate uridylyltransferase